MNRKLQRLATLIATLVWASPVMADEGSRHGVTLAISFQHEGNGALQGAEIGIRNDRDETICVSYNYQANTRVSVYRGAALVPQPNRFEGRPRPGCIEVAPGAGLSAWYDLRLLYRGVSLEKVRVCYVLPWRLGSYSRGRPERRSSVCGNAGE